MQTGALIEERPKPVSDTGGVLGEFKLTIYLNC